nr:putative uncharacterized protein DDB_G0270496 [Nicotiana tomentosiformis]
MSKSSNRSRKVEESESNSEFENDEMLNEMSDDVENFDEVNNSDDNNDYSDSDDDDDVNHYNNEDESGEQEEEEDEEGDQEEEEEDGEKLTEDHKIAGIEELKKEYMELKHKEQDLLGNLKLHKDEDLLKGQAVRNQKALWDKTLELRFLLQKAFSNSNRLPQEPIRSSFCDSKDRVKDAYSDLLASSRKTLDTILELQEVLLEKNPSITQSMDVNSGKRPKLSEDSVESNGEVDEDWQKISQMHSRMAVFRDKSIDSGIVFLWFTTGRRGGSLSLFFSLHS